MKSEYRKAHLYLLTDTEIEAAAMVEAIALNRGASPDLDRLWDLRRSHTDCDAQVEEALRPSPSRPGSVTRTAAAQLH